MPDEKQPTIEQTSRFTAKTKQGQDVEFEAKLKFFVSPAGEVRISTSGGESSDFPESDPPPQENAPGRRVRRSLSEQWDPINEGGSSTPDERPPSDDFGRAQPREDPREEPREELREVPREEPREEPRERRHQEFMRDPEVDRGHVRAPPDDCPIAQFVPDPCRALNDLGKSIKGWVDSVFPERNPPPNPPPPQEVGTGTRQDETDPISKQDQFEV